jgi:aminoglycoside/choline kinase family phosphotransferase
MLLSNRIGDNRALGSRGQSIFGMSKDQREVSLNDWARVQLASRSIEMLPYEHLDVVSDDASFRRYFRYQAQPHGYIFVDAPPDKEDSKPFVFIAKHLADAGLNAPEVYAVDYELGFMMLSDLGNTLYLSVLEGSEEGGEEGSEEGGHESLYQDALKAIYAMQFIDAELPVYDRSRLQQEMDLFPDWFLKKQLGLSLSSEEMEMLNAVFELMIGNALEQPRFFVHRDYHSRNVMVTRPGFPGIIDFQDAVKGAVTYDLVSLLRDCYLALPSDEVTRWVNEFRCMLLDNGRIEEVDEITFRRWFDLMGLQRHLKCAGIFSRLNLRDGKSGYLSDIPRVVSYMIEVCREYQELHRFGDWLSEAVEPELETGLFE